MTPPELNFSRTVEKVTPRFSKRKGSAWISHKDRTWLASFDREVELDSNNSCSSENWTPHSPLIALIHWIYENEPEQARAILRNRIFTQLPLTAIDRGFVKVAAKRALFSSLEFTEAMGAINPPNLIHISPLGVPIAPTDERRIALPERIDSDVAGLALALQLAHQVPRQSERFRSSRPIAAILTDENGLILETALNHNAINRTLHAEVNLVRRYWHRHPGEYWPKNAVLYTSLKPCKMCAALIWSAQKQPGDVRVLFAEDDLGPMARRTLLDLS